MPALLVLVVSAATHLFRLGQPFSVVFDEVYFGDFARDYWNGIYFFDIHPPLAKLATALIGYILGLQRYVIDWTHIGNPLPPAAVALRYMPTLAGILLPVVIYYLCRRLKFSKIAAMTAGLLICLENSLIVQSRYILFDLVMLLCGFTAILCYLIYIQRADRKRHIFLAASALLVACAVSIKWTGLAYLLLIGLMEAWRMYSHAGESARIRLKKFFSLAGMYGGTLLVIYVAVFAVHFAVLPKSGPGDAFMTQQFQKTLQGNSHENDPSIKASNFPAKFIELNLEMYRANKTLTATHSYSSKWYTWPLMLRPIFYWQGSTTVAEASTTPYIYLLGNPVIYWLGALMMMGLVTYLFIELVTKELIRMKKIQRPVEVFLAAGFLVNFLPYIFIGRVMFLYHYEAALVFSIMAIAFLLDQLETSKKRLCIGAVLVLALISFVFWSPLTYGLPLSDQQLSARMWFPSWR